MTKKRFWVRLGVMAFCCMSLMVNGDGVPRKLFEFHAEPGNPRSSEGSFVTLHDGRLMFAYSHFTGDDGSDEGHGVIGARYSSDDGESWSDVRIIVPQEGDLNVMSASLLRLQDDRIALFYLRKENAGMECRPMMRVTTDEGETWSEPVSVLKDKPGYYVLNNDRAIQLKSGRILLPLVAHYRPDDDTIGRGKVFSAMSDDGGQTWHTGQEHNAVNERGEAVILQEPGAIELKDGRVMMFCRTGEGCQYVNHSTDGGETWDAPHASNIIGPLSPASIKRLHNGDLLLVWNDQSDFPPEWINREVPEGSSPAHLRKVFQSNHVERLPLSTAISRDEGQTWELNKNLEGEGYFCYVAVHVMEDAVLLSYVHGGPYCDRMIKVPLSWIYDPTPRPPYHYRPNDAFKNVPDGEFTTLETPLGTWSVVSGKALVIDYSRGRGIHLEGGEDSCLELALPSPTPLRELRLALERFTRAKPYRMIVEAWKDETWVLVDARGEGTQAMGQHYLNPAEPDLETTRLRFRCNSVRGVIICDRDANSFDLHEFFVPEE